MRYVNCSGATMTFYGIEIKPHESKDFPGFINVKGFYPVEAETAEQVEPVKEQNEKAEGQVEVKTTRSKKSKDGEN